MLKEDRTPHPEPVPGYRWRPARFDDALAMHQLLLAADQADDNTRAGLLEDVERNFNDPWTDPPADSLVAAAPDGQLAAMGWVYVNPESEQEHRAFLWGEVHPDHRGRGLGEALLSWLEARGAHRLAHKPAGARRVLRNGAPENLAGRMALFKRHGFQPVRYFYKMRRDLRQEIPARQLPAGLELANYTSELDRPLWEAFNASFSDHWSFEPVSYADWQTFFTGRSAFHPDLTFLALDGEQVAAFSANYSSPEENALSGYNEGWIGQLGTRREWRRRGLATGLLCLSMQAFKAAGLDYATLGVDTENPTGALGIYERLGFVAVRRFITFEKEV